MMFATILALVSLLRLIVAALHDVKLAGHGAPGAGDDDRTLVLCAATAVGLAAALSPVAGVLGGVLLLVVIAGLWLDAFMWRAFTVELGRSAGVGALVLPVLWRELTGTAHARAFLRAHRAFLLVPIAAAQALLAVLWPPGSAALILTVVATAALASLVSLSHRDARRMQAATLAAFVFAAASRALGVGAFEWVALGALIVARLAAPKGDALPTLKPLFIARPIVVPRRFHPRPQHGALVDARARRPAHSQHFGACAGRDIVLFTVESLARDHLQRHRPARGARTPFIDALHARGTSSRHHFSPTPMTNDAHVAWYANRHGPGPIDDDLRPKALHALAASGYRTVYATSADVSHYGLRAILDAAGFDAVIDAAELPGGDPALVRRLPQRLAARRPDRPRLFLHVHTADTHIPYVVNDPTRFARFDAQDDEGRFLNGVEEADHVLGGALEALIAHGVVEDPLVVLTGDHGQAFGELGYRSHGSGLAKEQVLVPFVVAHPSVRPTVVDASSHFDVLPTILDLVGVAHPPALGRSVFAEPAPTALVLTAGRPSVTTTSCFGYVVPGEKVMIDLVLDRAWRMGWNDEEPTPLTGDERAYAASLAAAAFHARGLE